MLAYLTLLCAALAFAAAIAVWLRLAGHGAGAGKTLEVLQRQEALLGTLRTDVAQLRSELVAAQAQAGRELRAEQGRFREEVAASLTASRGELGESLRGIRDEVHHRLEAVRTSVDRKLQEIREDNGARLEQMRVTVDEKLQSTLELRLGESFKLVGEQLERVQTGLGEMQALATGVGDLKRVLTNVKTRGTWGEIQLGALLEQVLTPEQYATNVAVKEGSRERVEFAVRLPGRGEAGDGPVWLPIDAKFPQEDYLRLEDAREAADLVAMDVAGKNLEQSIRSCARAICTKYLDPPRTTDIGIMFLPTESLYAEVARRPGLLEALQREFRVLVAGPSTLAALLNSLQMGFRTLAIQQRTSEVWTVLGNVKTQFGKFEGLLTRVHKKLQEATSTVEETQKQTRVLTGRMRDVEALPIAEELTELTSGDVEAVPDMLEIAGR
jgi:DNA recombination protein RmuC